MTEQQYKEAARLRDKMFQTKIRLDFLKGDSNNYELPQEMWERNVEEIRAFLEGELVRLRAEFEAL